MKDARPDFRGDLAQAPTGTQTMTRSAPATAAALLSDNLTRPKPELADAPPRGGDRAVATISGSPVPCDTRRARDR